MLNHSLIVKNAQANQNEKVMYYTRKGMYLSIQRVDTHLIQTVDCFFEYYKL